MAHKHFSLALTLLTLAACSAGVRPSPSADEEPVADATRLPTGVRLDPAGTSHAVGAFPLAVVPTPRRDRVALLLNGWSKTGVQIVDWKLGRVTQTIDLPAAFLGLAFSPDGQWLAASGGNTDMVYMFRWTGDSAVLADSIRLAPPTRGRRQSGVRYPSQLAYSPDGQRLYVAENLGDSLAVIDVARGTVIQRLPVGRYPYGVVVGPTGSVYVSVWGGSSVVSFTAKDGMLVPARTMAAGRHPSAMLLDKAGRRLFVASASTDRIAILDATSGARVGELRDPPPAGPSEGSTPNALALSPDESRLFVAEADANSVAIFDLDASGGRLAGRVPVGWYPAAIATIDSTVVVANGKGGGTRANPDGPGPRESLDKQGSGANGTLGQLRGSLTVLDGSRFDTETLRRLSERVTRANGWSVAKSTGRIPPFRHVIYVIRENRTYDQVLGDLPHGDGDTSLVYFGNDVTPNAHAIATRFGVFDRFFVNAEVSADGHNWTTAAYASDYVEKTVQPNYSGRGRSYDYEGTNRGVVPANDDDDVNSPSTGYLWTLAARKNVSLRNYGEFVEGDGPGKYKGVKAELKATTNPDFPGFTQDITDQHRADVWLAELETYVKAGSMPALEIVRLPNDHTSGAAAGKPTPRAAVADNDLALGRMIAALSRTPFWSSTVVFVVEDDAQNGPDHVDSHRSPFLVISPYNRAGVYHRFTNTTDVLATIEAILGLESLSQFDYFGRPLTTIWADEPDLSPYVALTPKQSLTELNPAQGRGAVESRRLRLDVEDASDDDDFSEILWHAIKGYDAPYPGPRRMSLLEQKRGR